MIRYVARRRIHLVTLSRRIQVVHLSMFHSEGSQQKTEKTDSGFKNLLSNKNILGYKSTRFTADYLYPVNLNSIMIHDLLHLHFAFFLVKTPHLRQEMST
ncbi:hypothetical protein Y032_0580g251 [Ancylostoma ceylanicum]|uniref:Uncharacterized protein n=1 Tax=Ancylostoma ceylanicum TaxID=53326 RepID=A0A016WQ62_9BILA|nr:hypothetical protein Y032_0580g251 [Ancylostoma ceylanicum]